RALRPRRGAAGWYPPPAPTRARAPRIAERPPSGLGNATTALAGPTDAASRRPLQSPDLDALDDLDGAASGLTARRRPAGRGGGSAGRRPARSSGPTSGN